jgi:hypothetical protein
MRAIIAPIDEMPPIPLETHFLRDFPDRVEVTSRHNAIFNVHRSAFDNRSQRLCAGRGRSTLFVGILLILVYAVLVIT